MTHSAMQTQSWIDPHGGALKLHRGATFGEVSIIPLQPSKPVNPPIPEIGTEIAINYLSKGVAAQSPISTGRGGARNYATRESDALTKAHVTSLIAATSHSYKIGLPFNRMITIHWQAAGIALPDIAEATGRFLDLFTKWLGRCGYRTAWLWVHEGGDNKGGHCHMLVHVPAALVSRLTGLQKRWLRRISGKPYRRHVILSRPIGGWLGLENGNPGLHANNLEVALAYVLKGACPTAALHFGLTRLEYGGRIIGKRCGTSQNIATKARKLYDERCSK
jgi:hypothetical protein